MILAEEAGRDESADVPPLVGRVDLLARLDGVAAGTAVYGRPADAADLPVGRIALSVLPEHCRRGVATALHRAVSERARARGDEQLEAQVGAPTEATRAYCAARGYVAVERLWESRLALPPPRLAWNNAVEGLSVRSADDGEEVLRDAYAIALESEPDIPQTHEWVAPRDFEAWRAREVDPIDLVREASVVAYIGNTPAAYGLVARGRDGAAEHWATGVARSFRGRGLTYAVKREQMARAARAGVRELVARNHDANVAMRRVNEKLGYRVTREIVTYRGPLL